MQRKLTIILTLIMGVMLIVTFVITYIDQVKNKNYLYYLKIPCDYSLGKCFISEESVESYLKMYKTANLFESCIYGGFECNFSCEGADSDDCKIITCSEDTLEEKELCLIN